MGLIESWACEGRLFLGMGTVLGAHLIHLFLNPALIYELLLLLCD